MEGNPHIITCLLWFLLSLHMGWQTHHHKGCQTTVNCNNTPKLLGFPRESSAKSTVAIQLLHQLTTNMEYASKSYLDLASIEKKKKIPNRFLLCFVGFFKPSYDFSKWIAQKNNFKMHHDKYWWFISTEPIPSFIPFEFLYSFTTFFS